jgi:hypothetical protein
MLLCTSCNKNEADKSKKNKNPVQTTIQGCEAGPTTLHTATADTMAWNNQDATAYQATNWLGNLSPFDSAAPYAIGATAVSAPLSLSNLAATGCSTGAGCYYYYQLQKPDKSFCQDDNGTNIYFLMHVKG